MLADLKPILIASPVHRSGTTLLQRLLCSSPDTLIYGESLANDMNFFFSLMQNKEMLMGGESDWRAQQLEQVLAGDVNEWIPDMLPPFSWVKESFAKASFQYFGGYAQFAEEKGRTIWGAKLPGWQPAFLANVLRYLPQAKILYIVRDLAACVRSAKLIGLCQSLVDIQQFAQSWQMNQRNLAFSVPERSRLMIDYNRLCTESEDVILEMEVFTGVQSIDINVLQHRINNYDRTRETPPELTEQEQHLIQTY